MSNQETSQIDSKFINHLTKYRVTGAPTQYIGEAVAPYIKATLSLGGEPVKSTVKSVDSWFDTALTTVDGYLPSALKRPETTVGPNSSMIARQANAAVNNVQTAVASVRVSKAEPSIHSSLYETYLHQPLHETALNVRSSYSGIYDTHGKALLRGSLDPLTGPINGQLELFVVNNFPKAQKVPKEGFSNEMSRTVRIVGNALTSLIPSSVTQTTNHIMDTYAENYVNQNVNSVVAPLTATINTTRVLSNEVVQLAASAVNNQRTNDNA